jgi:hypothetical protein
MAPSHRSPDRASWKAIRQYRAGVAPRLLMTGGAVQNQFVEAQVMMQFARSQGVPDSALFAEGESRNTIQNAYYSYKIMQAHGWNSALVVSSPSHLRRASLIFSHYPFAWRMHAAPWPPDYPLWKRLWFWCSETGYTSYGRLFGFPNARQYLPTYSFHIAQALEKPPIHAQVSGFQFKRPQQLAALLLLLLAGAVPVGISSPNAHLAGLRLRPLRPGDVGKAESPGGLLHHLRQPPRWHPGLPRRRLPLTLQRMLAGQNADTSTWEMRHELGYVLLLLHSGFLLTGICLGGALWWVTRRLFGNPGGFIALALYCFCPPVIHACTYPNNEILAAFGLFASLYTAMGVAHAMQGPPKKWRSRIILLTLTLAFTAASHVAAFLLALLLAIGFMAYLAVGPPRLHRSHHDDGQHRNFAAGVRFLRLQPGRLQLLLSQRRGAHLVFSAACAATGFSACLIRP